MKTPAVYRFGGLGEVATISYSTAARISVTAASRALRAGCIAWVCALALGPSAAAAAPPATTPTAPDPFQQALYAVCSAAWRTLHWEQAGGPIALAAGGRPDGSAHCFPAHDPASVEAAAKAALEDCRSVYDEGCSIFAENHSLSFWAEDVADSYRHRHRSDDERRYIRCSRPGLWEHYLTAKVPVVMAVGEQDGDYHCYFTAAKTYTEASARALDYCREHSSGQCDVFAVGGYLRERFLRAGDRLRGRKRSEYEYLYLACLDPADFEGYRALDVGSGNDRLIWGEWQDGFEGGADGERYRCPTRVVSGGSFAAEQDLSDDCNARKVQCLAVAYGMTLRPWAKAVVDRLQGRHRSAEFYMLYACAMYDAEENLEQTPLNRILLGIRTKGDLRYDCLWQFGAPSKAAAIAAVPCDRAKYECRLVASDGILDAAFKPYVGAKAGSGLPRDLLETLAEGGADVPALRPPGIGPPLVTVEGAPPLGPVRQAAPSAKGRTP